MSTTTLERIAGVGDWIECRGPEGTLIRGQIRSVDDKGGVAAWEGGTQSRFSWNDLGLRKIDPPVDALFDVPAENAARHNGPDIRRIPVTDICPFSLQARTEFDPEALQNLADDIKTNGLHQEITVRPAHPTLGKPFEIVCGERRWRAVQLAGLPEIAAKVRDVDDRTAVLIATAENVQRRDLNPLELSRNIRMLQQVNVPQEEIGKLFGHSQSWVSRTESLLTLPGPVQDWIRGGQLTQSHAEELLSLRKWPKELIDLARQCVEGEWTSAALAANVRTLKGRMEAKERLPLDEPETVTETVRETVTTTTRETETRPDVPLLVHCSKCRSRCPDVVPDGFNTVICPDCLERFRAGSRPAEAPSVESPAPAPQESAEKPKPGALKTAEEKLQERIAERDQAPAKPSAWEGKTSVVISNDLAARLARMGHHIEPAVTTFCQLAVIAATYELSPSALVTYLERFLDACCDHQVDPDAAIAAIPTLARDLTRDGDAA